MDKSKSAEEVILEAYNINKLEKIAEKGCVSGAAHDHVYYNQTLDFFDKYEDEMIECIAETVGGDEINEELWTRNTCNYTGYRNDVVWTYIELIASNYLEEIENDESGNHLKTVEFLKRNQKNLDPQKLNENKKLASKYLDSGCDKESDKNFKGAIEDYTKAIELCPTYAEVYANRGCAKEELKDQYEEWEIYWDWMKAVALGDKEAEKWIEGISGKCPRIKNTYPKYVIHCKRTAQETLMKLGLDYDFKYTEIDVTVRGIYGLTDQEQCENYGIDWKHVISVEHL